MTKTLLIDALHTEETRVAILDENGCLDDFDCEIAGRKQITGNIYVARVVRIEPALQAAFLEYGNNRQGFLPLSELHPSYFLNGEKNVADASAIIAPTDENLIDDDVPPRPALPHYKQVRIQNVLKRRQLLLVQVTKEERGHKGAALTTYINLPGRYGIYMPNTANGIGVSKKITQTTERQRLKEIYQSFDMSTDASFIIRTAACERTKAELKRDFDYLSKLWQYIQDTAQHVRQPQMVYEESNLVKRAVRDMYGRDITAIYVQGESAYREAKEFMKVLAPSHAKNVHLHKSCAPLFTHFRLEETLENLFSSHVPLPSGGSLVIHHTEALVAIDVNSGRANRESSVEETAYRTNSEAAVEAARQVRLRDLAGLIVIDFIDMSDPNNIKNVEKRFKDTLKGDRARVQIGRISSFGLLEMSRQRLRPGVLDIAASVCNHCKGTGRVRAPESLVLSILRHIANAAQTPMLEQIDIRVHSSMAHYLLNKKRHILYELEKEHRIHIAINSDDSMLPDAHQISTTLSPDAAYETAEHVATSLQETAAPLAVPPAYIDNAVPVAPTYVEPSKTSHLPKQKLLPKAWSTPNTPPLPDIVPNAVLGSASTTSDSAVYEYRADGSVMLILEQRI